MANIKPNPAQQATDYTDIANRAQSALGRGVHPSTAKAIIEAYEAAHELTAAQGVSDDLEIAETALQRFHDKFMERAHVDPSTGYPEYGSQEEYYADLCAALDSVKELKDVPADPRDQEYEP